MLKSFVVVVLSAVFAVIGTVTLATAAEANHWCCVHSWALMHGSGLGVLLGFGLVGFHVVSIVGARAGYLSPSWPLGWLTHVAYLGSALGTVGYFQRDEAFMWFGLISTILACVLKVRGRAVRQFGLAVVSLVVSCLSVAEWGYMTWVIWHLRSHS